MSERQEYLHYYRDWLNDRGFHSTAFILATIQTPWKGNRWLDAAVTIADCSRQITLDFDFDLSKKAGYNNALKKLDKIIESLVDFRVALVAAKEAYDRGDFNE